MHTADGGIRELIVHVLLTLSYDKGQAFQADHPPVLADPVELVLRLLRAFKEPGLRVFLLPCRMTGCRRQAGAPCFIETLPFLYLFLVYASQVVFTRVSTSLYFGSQPKSSFASLEVA